MHIISNSSKETYYSIRTEFKTTNNEVEYEVSLARFAIVKALGAIEVKVKASSQVMVNQVKEYAAKSERFQLFLR